MPGRRRCCAVAVVLGAGALAAGCGGSASPGAASTATRAQAATIPAARRAAAQRACGRFATRVTASSKRLRDRGRSYLTRFAREQERAAERLRTRFEELGLDADSDPDLAGYLKQVDAYARNARRVGRAAERDDSDRVVTLGRRFETIGARIAEQAAAAGLPSC